MVRCAVVGYGNIGQTHVRALLDGAIPRAQLSALVSRKQQALPSTVRQYQTLSELLAADIADLVIVATPTMTHPQVAQAVVEAGRHLLVEKPVAMSLQQAQALVAAVPAGCQAAVMLNQRYHPVYAQMKDIVASGVLGPIRRFNWLMTTWYRPDVYFQVSDWRGTWPGEGGGALMNQCIHNLDVLQWIVGMPDAVVADARFGKYHDIEVEDEVSALLTYANGCSGVLVASTGEAPGINRFDIIGDGGSLQFDGETLILQRADQPVPQHCATTREMFGLPGFTATEVACPQTESQHVRVLSDVVASILDDVPQTMPLQAGLASIELANALLLSAWRDQRVSLPLDAGAYERALSQRIASSALRTAQDLEAEVDMNASYR